LKRKKQNPPGGRQGGGLTLIHAGKKKQSPSPKGEEGDAPKKGGEEDSAFSRKVLGHGTPKDQGRATKKATAHRRREKRIGISEVVIKNQVRRKKLFVANRGHPISCGLTARTAGGKKTPIYSGKKKRPDKKGT